ncbi:acyl-homoserine-lactone synthase [Vibrio quintilis]|uniref:acyl-homoserine-lactone synthase n=1 Tax=Vibrio quintilis TaxID=1117707 RepID=A0A1M7YXB3_9VIBR|nr:acyl-homoserine-lactone synthase [Vibrio quintilis]SHO57248.1 Acyl-homoserine-lactone synthase LuxM [Vibrio quintilis]
MKPAQFYYNDQQEALYGSDKFSLFQAVEQLDVADTRKFLGNILNTRLQQLNKISPEISALNIANKLCLSEYDMLLSQPKQTLSKDALWVEMQALNLFDSFADFWCDFELYQVKKKYTHALTSSSCGENEFITYSEQDYNSQLIINIEGIKETYLTPYFEYPMSLSDAILLFNLSTSVKENRWYEMLFSLELSTKGSHFVLFIPIKSEPQCSLIISTAKIQFWSKDTDWLYLSPFFVSDNWKLCSKVSSLQKNLNEFIPIYNRHLLKFNSSAELDKKFIELIHNKENICEVIRLTVCGSTKQKSFLLYLAQKRMISLLEDINITLGFVITGQPLIVNYYKSLEDNAYINISKNNLNDTRNYSYTYKGLWVINKLNRHFQESDYRTYKKKSIQQVRLASETK